MERSVRFSTVHIVLQCGHYLCAPISM